MVEFANFNHAPMETGGDGPGVQPSLASKSLFYMTLVMV